MIYGVKGFPKVNEYYVNRLLLTEVNRSSVKLATVEIVEWSFLNPPCRSSSILFSSKYCITCQ